MAKEKVRGIYCIENITNSKKYIGQSKDIYGRWGNHKWCLNNNKHSNSYLQNAWNKYGEQQFKFYLLEACSQDNIDLKEKYYISKHNTLIDDNGYNLDSGGNQNKFHSDVTIKKMSDSAKGRTFSKEVRRKISESRKGKCIGEDHHQYGKPLSNSTKKKISESNKGIHSDEKHYEATKVICLTTGEVFETIKSAAKHHNTYASNISKCCNGERLSSGLQGDIPLQWAYFNDSKDVKKIKYKKTPELNKYHSTT